MASCPTRRPLTTLRANLSFWVTDEPITLKQLDTAESLLVKLYYDFLELYVTQGVTYRNFCRRALRNHCSVAINYKIVPQSVNKIVETYSRVFDILKGHRQYVIEAYTRKSGFDNEAALLLLARCETRRRLADKPISQKYPDAKEYDSLAKCANDFDVFSSSITGADIIDFRDGNLEKSLPVPNMSRAIFFFSLLEKLHYLPRNWKKIAVSRNILIDETTGEAPSINSIYVIASRNPAAQYLEDTTSPTWFSQEKFYSSITRAIKSVVRRK